MASILGYIGTGLFVIFFFGFCIFIHEVGHFLAAKWRGLHIVAFSIGFKKIWGFTHKGVEYRIGCLPFGGYVDLPQIDATGEPRTIDDKPLPPAKPIDRIITAFAGPLFNILFGFALATLIWYIGIPQDTPKMSSITVAHVDKESPEYNAGLREGDKIVKFNGRRFYLTWNGFVQEVILHSGKVNLEVIDPEGKEKTVSYQPKPNNKMVRSESLAYPFFMPKIPVYLYPLSDSPAAKAGLEKGDQVISIDGHKINGYGDFTRMTTSFEPKKLNLTVLRDGSELSFKGVLTEANKNIAPRYTIGIAYGGGIELIVDEILPGSSADKAGLRVGDAILKINGKEIADTSQFEKIFSSEPTNRKIDLLVKRGDEDVQIDNLLIAGKDAAGKKFKVKVEYNVWVLVDKVLEGSPAEVAGLKSGDIIKKISGKSLKDKTFSETITKGVPFVCSILRDNKPMEVTLAPRMSDTYNLGVKKLILNHLNPWQQFVKVISMSYRTLKGVFSKKSTVKARNMSGPLGIIRAIALTAHRGTINEALFLIVVITFSLGLLNLLPLPVLDGGHITMAFIQMIRRKPLSPKVVAPLTYVFVVFLISFMLYITFYDSKRIYHDMAGYSTGMELTFLESPKTEVIKNNEAVPSAKTKEPSDTTR
jgi:RIP metalloprotease RseP